MDPYRQTPTLMIRRFDAPDRLVNFDHGNLEVITVGALVSGLGHSGAPSRPGMTSDAID